MKKKLNILFLASWYPNKLDLQNGNFIQQHARAVSKVCNVYSLHIVSSDQEEDFIVDSKLNQNVFEVVVYVKSIKVSPLSLFKKRQQQKHAYLKGYFAILKRATKIDLVHLNVVFPAGLFALYLKKKFGIPFILTEHWTIFLKTNPVKLSKLKSLLIKRIGKKASYICPVSHDLKNALIAFGMKGNFEVIPNVVNTEYFFLKPKTLSSVINILHVSSLKNEQKNVIGILNVIKKLSVFRADFVLTIVGDGDVNPILDHAHKLKIDKKFLIIKSRMPLEMVAKEMQNHDLFLLFSNYENLPCVIAESLVSGLPILASNVGGISEMIDENNGVLVDALNEAQLKSSLNFMLDNLHTYNRELIAAEATSTYNYDAISLQFLSVYSKALNS